MCCQLAGERPGGIWFLQLEVLKTKVIVSLEWGVCVVASGGLRGRGMCLSICLSHEGRKSTTLATRRKKTTKGHTGLGMKEVRLSSEFK